MLIPTLLLVSVLATSILSGLLGMAGGMILMAILVSVVSVASAMMIHGAVQATANGSRAWFLRSHIQWHILPAYALGAITTLGGFTLWSLIPPPGVVLVVVGIFPWLARILPRFSGLDVTRKPVAFACGVVVTSAQLLAGASGPLLDVFYLNSQLDRYQIIASKAFTQTLGHLLKIVYYGRIVRALDDTVSEVGLVFYAVAMATAVVGTRIGTLLLDRFSDAHFRRVSGNVILAIATVCVIKGVVELV